MSREPRRPEDEPFDDESTDDGAWVESTEGDLDPDLTEEAGYAGWEPPARRFWTPEVLRLIAVLLIVVMVSSVVIAAVL